MSKPTILHLVVDPILDVLFVVLMKALMPIRRKGVFGTPDRPVYLNKGDNIPHWLEMRSPWLIMKASCDCETYYDEKEKGQVIRPLYKQVDYVMEVEPVSKHPMFNDGIVVGAATYISTTPRPKRPVIVEKVEFDRDKEILLPVGVVAILFIVALDYNLIYYVVLGIIAGMLYDGIREKLVSRPTGI